MSYFDWRGNKQGKSIYDTKIPIAICLLLPIIILLVLLLCGCSTTATRKDDGTLMIKGIGSAKWPDGAEIKGEPMIKFPSLPSTIIGK